ncbi:MAG: trypsin-like peptidase domain-containing protein [Candidatus Poribacteria bacterium]|nr:trypsin-like peptidase domain-containing protein [Candidatus Poribacteria bacterium]
MARALRWLLCCVVVTGVSNVPASAQALDPMEVVGAFESVMISVVEGSREAVVAIDARDVTSPAGLESRVPELIPFTSGTGFFIDADGHIMTNDHVVHKASRVNVKLHDGTELEARIVGVDPNTDIAVLKVDLGKPAHILPMGDSDAARLGQFVFSVGNPLGLEFSANIGIISAKGRTNLVDSRGSDLIRYQDYIQTDAYMNVGNSGGPLVNLRGEVIGINTMIRTGRDASFSGLGFAIPINLAKSVGEQLIEHGEVVRGFLGISYVARDNGVFIRYVNPDTPADKGGLQRGDLITHINGEFIDGTTDDKEYQFRWRIAGTRPGERLRFTVLRDGRPRSLEVELGEMPPQYRGEAPEPRELPHLVALGIKVKTLPAMFAENKGFAESDKGIIILSVNEESVAYKDGMRVDDLIVAVNGKAVETPEECEDAIVAALSSQADLQFSVKKPEDATITVPFGDLLQKTNEKANP